MTRFDWQRKVAVALAVLMLGPAVAWACPFCAATGQTLSEEMTAADVVVLAKLVATPEPEKKAGEEAGPGNPAVGESTFRVVKVLKGDEHVKVEGEIKALHFGENTPDATFLLNGQLIPELGWGTPIPLSSRAQEYVTKLPSLPEKGADRLAFFQDYFEDEDQILSQDSYDEFARAPYSDVKDLKDRMHHDKFVQWIQDVEITPSHRRLYLTLLGVCGNENDLPMLEEAMRSDDRRMKAGLDALIACYLTLKGPDGMELVEELFLKNAEAEYADTYAAIMALRFHGQDEDIIPKPRLVQGLRHMLNRPELADLVIADLARWEDWEIMDRLVELFKNADESSSWVRVPVINYLEAARRQSPERAEEVEAIIAELETIDPGAVKQARTFAAFGGLAATKVEPQAEAQAAPAAAESDDPAPSLAATETAAEETAAEKADDAQPQSAEAQPADAATATEVAAAASSEASQESTQLAAGEEASSVEGTNGQRITIFLVLGAVVLVVLGIVSRSAKS